MDEPRSIAFHAFSPQGMALGRTLAAAMEGTLFIPERLLRDASGGVSGIRPFSSLDELMADQFHHYAAHVFIGAAGIAVRAIAPHLRGKTVDPAVVVCENHGRYVISLLSGHVGGANALARNLAERTGGQAVITTATDSEGLPALDLLADIAHCRVADPDALKRAAAALLAGRKPVLDDPDRLLDLSDEDRSRLFQPCPPPGGQPESVASAAVPAVIVGVKAVRPAPERLRLFARRLHVGLGYRKGTPPEALVDAVRRALAEAGLAEEALAALASATLKADDPAIHEAARRLDAPVRFFSPAELERVPVPHPSPKAAEVLGCGPLSVSEGAALLSAGVRPDAGSGPRLVVPKRTDNGITVAIALP